MNTLSREEWKSLMTDHKGICVSLFLPTDRTGLQIQQNQIRFRNLLREAENRLAESGLRPADIKTFLDPAQGLVNNVLFWRKQSDGLALFLGADFFRSYRVPVAFEERLVVADRFHLKPLLPLMREEERFYVLALSQNALRLFEGTRQRLDEMDLETLPGNLADALQQDEPEKQVRFRSGAAGGAMVSGHGASLEDAKDKLLKYFRKIDKGLRDVLRNERAPMVLAGVEYLFPIYREANTYPCLLDGGIPGNPEGMGNEQLQRLAWDLVAPSFRRAEEDALAQYRQSSGTGLTCADIAGIVRAACHGRVGTLFLAAGEHRWGLFDPTTEKVQMHERMEAGSEELLDFAAMQTYLSGGAVFVVAADRMPENGVAAALLRY